MITAAIYVRRTELGIPIEDQVAACHRVITQQGWKNGTVYLDEESFSGTPGRGYSECLGDMRRRRMEMVVAHSAERMFRDLDAIEEVLQSARAGNVGLHLCVEGISTAGTHGAFLVQAAQLVAKVVRCRRSEVLSNGIRRSKARGIRIGRPPKLTPILDAHIEELFALGHSQYRVENDLGVTRAKVRQVWRQYTQRADAPVTKELEECSS